MKTLENAPTYKDPSICVATTVANLRLQVPPSYGGATAKDQTYSIAIVIGSSTAFDGTAGVYCWDSESATADNGTTVIAPTSPQGGGNPGRWRRLGSAL